MNRYLAEIRGGGLALTFDAGESCTGSEHKNGSAKPDL
jgi:hypothetical protein